MQRFFPSLFVIAFLLGSSITSAPARTVPSGTIEIGFTGPLSGGAADYGADVQRGVQMAIDEVNAGGGIMVGGKRDMLKLISFADRYRPSEAAINARRLAQHGAPTVFVPHSGGIFAAMGFNEKPTPKFIVAAYSSDPAILKADDASVVMIPPSFDSYYKPFTAIEMKRFGKKLGLIPTTTAYGNAWTKGFTAAWQAAGGTVLSNNGIDYNTSTDFLTSVSKTLAEKPDVIFVGGPSQPTALIMKLARDQDFTGGFVMMDQAKFDQVQQVLNVARLEGAVGLMPFRETPGNGIKIFVDKYTKKFGTEREPNPEQANNYEAMHVFAEAIRLA